MLDKTSQDSVSAFHRSLANVRRIFAPSTQMLFGGERGQHENTDSPHKAVQLPQDFRMGQ